MDPIIGGALIGLGGNILGGLFGNSAQKKANKTNIMLQQKQLDWQERMANTEYQRGVSDMKAAGINPMVAFQQGGASSPNVSAATVIPEDAIARGVSSAADKAALMLQLKQMDANIALTRANAQKATAEAKTAGVTSGNAAERQHWEIQQIRKDVERTISQFQLNDSQRRQIEELLPLMVEREKANIAQVEAQTTSARAEGQLKEAALPSARAEAEVWEKLGAAGRGANIGANALQQIILIIRSMLR